MNADTLLTFDDREQSILEWALDYGVTPDVIIARLKRGATVKEAISAPMRAAAGQRLPIFHRRQRVRLPTPSGKARPGETYTVNGVERTFKEWATSLGIGRQALALRLKAHGSLEAAVARGSNQRPLRG